MAKRKLVIKSEKTEETLKELSLEEFRDIGYLQEVNRQVLHLVGLAMYVEIDDATGEATGIGVIDYRDDPEGVFFPNGADREKGERVYQEVMKRAAHRKRLFGGRGLAQPIDETMDPQELSGYRKSQEKGGNVLNK
ncbi:MAG: hypothetical protein JRI53_08100 [Deltaproteobacteria bacterium]|nr:hypothetical protein [Deltaproteobacteria bacterium]